jgi:predicted kinase
MTHKVYIFRGSPLSGKSTIAPLFSGLLPKPVACIRHDMLRWDVHKMDRHFTEVSSEEHRFAFENLVMLFEQYLKQNKYNIVIEGLFTWDDHTSDQGNVSSLIALAKRYKTDCTSIVLKADKDKLLARNKERAQQVPMDEFNTLYNNIYKTIDPSEIIVDTTTDNSMDTLLHLKAKLHLN